MKQFWLIRHGESSANAGEVSRDNHDVNLTQNGQAQAQWASAHFPHTPSQLFVSQFPRTRQTAEPFIERFGLTPDVRPELNEFNPLGLSVIGGMNGRQRADAYEHYWMTATPEAQIGDDGEAFACLNARIDFCLNHLGDIPDRSILFGHSIWIKVLAWKLLGFSVRTQADMPMLRRFQHTFPTPNCSVFELTLYHDATLPVLRALPELTPPTARLDSGALYF